MENKGMTISCGGGTGFSLFLVFLVLKLVGVISWSWWWVTAPLWISAGLGLIGLIIALIVSIIAAFL